MKVSAVIPTRGDVDLSPILESLSWCDEVLVWDNSKRQDLSVYGRYAMIAEARNELILTQDDDCIVSDPQRIANAWISNRNNNEYGVAPRQVEPEEFLVANMPQEFRPHYPDSCLVGFGACFHRDLPDQAIERFVYGALKMIGNEYTGEHVQAVLETQDRTCDVWFTTLTPRVLVDVPVERLDYAFGANRMYNQPGHVEERTRVLEMARKVRDAS